MQFKVNDALVTSCTEAAFQAHTREELAADGLTESEYLSKLAPNGWTIGALDSWSAWADGESCNVEIPLIRNPRAYMVKYYIINNLFVFSAVLGMQLDPGSAPLAGARCSLIMLSMLLLATVMQGDLGLGHLEYLVILDIQAGTNVWFLGVALVHTVVCHRLHRAGEAHRAYVIDLVGR